MSIKKIIVVLGLVLGLAVMIQPDAAAALFKSDAAADACQGVSLGTAQGCGAGGGSRITDVITVIINLLSAIVGIIAVVMVIVSGFKYITAAGDSGKMTSAKSTLIYAIIGLIIVALAQALVKLVLDKVK